MIKLRDKAHSRYRVTKLDKHKQYYKSLKALVKSSIYREKCAYFNQCINSKRDLFSRFSLRALTTEMWADGRGGEALESLCFKYVRRHALKWFAKYESLGTLFLSHAGAVPQ
ncbi:hypothetical protein ACJJTC_005305 [Scirpophaga incertulas]